MKPIVPYIEQNMAQSTGKWPIMGNDTDHLYLCKFLKTNKTLRHQPSILCLFVFHFYSSFFYAHE